MANNRVARIFEQMRQRTRALRPKPAEAKKKDSPVVVLVVPPQREAIRFPVFEDPRRYWHKPARRGAKKARYKQPRRGCCRATINYML